MNENLTPYERWMVKSNLTSIKEGQDPAVIIATLKANGYPRIAAAVEQQLKATRNFDHLVEDVMDELNNLFAKIRPKLRKKGLTEDEIDNVMSTAMTEYLAGP